MGRGKFMDFGDCINCWTGYYNKFLLLWNDSPHSSCQFDLPDILHTWQCSLCRIHRRDIFTRNREINTQSFSSWRCFLWKNKHVLGSNCGRFDRLHGYCINVVCNSNKMGFHKIEWCFIYSICYVYCGWHRCCLHSRPLFVTDPGLHWSRSLFNLFDS